ncbi:uncharacterized protein LOC131952694 [Physella acuta]|uniref:uncharacterized protein LOC131952694 n=1 Tax=Physella acuta TaxID=109671 RepID=UPI0027DBF6EE|nr:uncharacterized protein LOC131952694 [Physella acuta]
MKINRRTAITLGSLSCFVIIGGILYAVLVAVVTQKVSGKDDDSTLLDFIPFWTFGFAYIIPGILGFIAAFVQKKWLYVLVLIISIILLMGMVGLINLFSFSFFVGMMSYKDFSYCSTINDQCVCRQVHICIAQL